MDIQYKYKQATKNQHPITEIFFNGEKVGYFMPLYNKPEFRYMEKGNHNRWYVNINTDNFFLIEYGKDKEEIISKINENFQKTS